MVFSAKKALLLTLVLALPVVSILLGTQPAFAAFNLTATPSDGGFDLRFQRLSPTDFKQTKEITIRVTSDLAKQYRVVAQIIKPLTMNDGTTLPDGQFKFYPLVNSNSKGTLLYREESPVSDFDTILYTSNAAGESDSFRLVYSLTPQANQIHGSYYGQIAYILTPIDSTQSQVVVNIQVYAELSGGNVPVVELTTGTGSNRISLSSKGMRAKDELAFKKYPQVFVKIRGPLGAAYRIFAALEGGVISSSEGDEFDLSKVSVSAAGGQKGTLAQESDLMAATSKMLVYTSDAVGSGDEFVVTFKPAADFRLVKAGLYKGRLNFIVEKLGATQSGPEVFQALDLDFSIDPLFDMVVYSQGQEGVNLKFGEVSYKSGPKTSDVDVYVETNMGKPYQVIQKVSGPMVNEKMDKIPEEDFTLKVKDVASIQEPSYYLKDVVPAKEGETLLLSSGPKGESLHFKIEYQLKMRPESRGGNYATSIGYSLALN